MEFCDCVCNTMATHVLIKMFYVVVDGSMKEGVDPLEAYMASVGGHLDRGKKLLLKQQLHHLNNVSDICLSSSLIMVDYLCVKRVSISRVRKLC